MVAVAVAAIKLNEAKTFRAGVGDTKRPHNLAEEEAAVDVVVLEKDLVAWRVRVVPVGVRRRR